MPVYRTKPDISLDDLVGHLEWVGEPIIGFQPSGDEWLVVTQPIPSRRRPMTIHIDTDALGNKETR